MPRRTMTFTTASAGTTNSIRLGAFEIPKAIEIPAIAGFAATTARIGFKEHESSGSETLLYTTGAAAHAVSINTAASRVVLDSKDFRPGCYIQLVALTSGLVAVQQSATTLTCTLITRDYSG